MKFDDVIGELGEFGPYQKRVYFIVCLVGIPVAVQTLAGVFIQATPDHRCALPNLDNDTYESQGPWHDDLVNAYIPWHNDTDTYDTCRVRRTPGDLNNDTAACDTWVYSTHPFHNTFVSDTDLVCKRKALTTYANMIMMCGSLMGALVLGFLSDIIGRRKVLILSTCGHFAAAFGIAWVQTYELYVVLRFLIFGCGTGMYLSGYVVGIELVGPSKRKIAGIVVEILWCMGLFMETAIAYGLRDWAHFQMAISAFSIAYLVIVSIFVPESARWLLQKGRNEEATKIIMRAAEVNGVKLSSKASKIEDYKVEGRGETIWHMFKHPVLLFRSLIIFFNWLVASMVYYGLSLNASKLSGDIYLNFFLLAIVELASYIFCLAVMDRAGRKFLQCFSMVLGGVACVATLFPVIYGGDGYDWLNTCLSLAGKFGASAGFGTIYIYSSELFPTAMRSSGMGISSIAARVGGIVAPFIGDMDDVIPGSMGVALPLLIFGGLSVTAGLLVLFLPETTNRILPDTVEEAKSFGRSKKNGKKSYTMENGQDVLTDGNYNQTSTSDL